MNTQKPLSLKLLYWVSEIAYWIFIAIWVIAFGLTVRTLVGEFPDSLNLHVDAPFYFDVEQAGTFHHPKGDSTVYLKEARGKINFKSTPSYLTRPLAFSMLLAVTLMFIIISSVRGLIKGIYIKGYFANIHVIHIRNIAIGFSLLWLYTQIYMAIFSSLVRSHLEFEGIMLQNNIKVSGELLIVALFMWMLSYLMRQGVQLQDEQNLTI